MQITALYYADSLVEIKLVNTIINDNIARLPVYNLAKMVTDKWIWCEEGYEDQLFVYLISERLFMCLTSGWLAVIPLRRTLLGVDARRRHGDGVWISRRLGETRLHYEIQQYSRRGKQLFLKRVHFLSKSKNKLSRHRLLTMAIETKLGV